MPFRFIRVAQFKLHRAHSCVGLDVEQPKGNALSLIQIA